MRKARKIPGWQMTKVKSKEEVILEAQKERRTVHFCYADRHLPSQKFGVGTPISQKYNGRVVLRGDIVKDDSGSHAVFT